MKFWLLSSLLMAQLVFATESHPSKAAAPAAKTTDKKAGHSTEKPNAGTFQKAVGLTVAGQNQAALELWKEVLKADPNNAGAYYYAGVCRFNLGDMDKAAYNFKKGTAFPELGHNAWYYLGRVAERQNNKKLAEEHYKTYLSKSPSEKGKAEVQKRLTDLGASPSSPSEAKSAPAENTAVSASSTAPQASNTGSFKVQALPSGHLYAISAGSAKGNDLLQRAWQENSRGLVNQAVETLKQINRDYPDTPPSDASRFNLMSLYADLGLYDKVISVGNILLEKGIGEPMRSGVFGLMAEAAYNLKNLNDAGTYLQQARPGGQFGPTESQKLALQGKMLKGKDANGSLEQLKQAALSETDPLKRAEIEVQIGKSLAKSKPQEAVIYFKSAVGHCAGQKSDLCRKAVYGVADLSYKLKQWKDAEDYYTSAIRYQPHEQDSPWGLFQIGNIYREQARYQDALSKYDQLSKDFPSSKWVEQAKWRRDDVVWRQQHPGLFK